MKFHNLSNFKSLLLNLSNNPIESILVQSEVKYHPSQQVEMSALQHLSYLALTFEYSNDMDT